MEPTDEDVAQKVPKEDRKPSNALGDQYRVVGNVHLITDVLEELDRVTVSEMDSSECEAFGDVIQGLAYLQESLSEPERRPNAKLYGVTDDD